jgi:hypothetical protein
MNYLQLSQRLRQECGIAGAGPISVVGQVGEAKRLVDYINTAWLEIQGLQDQWGFMRTSFSFQTSANVGDYTPAAIGLTDRRYWYTDTLRAYLTSAGTDDEQWMVEWAYQVFRDTYRFGSQTPGRPMVFAVRPQDNALMLGSVPDAVYTITGEYQKTPSELVGNDDTPEIPTHLHMVIVYKAMEYYALFEAAGEVLAQARAGYSRLIAQLQREQLPQIGFGNPLA